MTSVRLLADDLTGALDSAAELVGLTGPIPTFWHPSIPDILPPNAALDTGTRERDATQATAITRALAPRLAPATIAFKKIDSLLRGPSIAEVAACLHDGAWPYAVLAPAFPFQGRITRGFRQYARTQDGTWHQAGPDLVPALREMGIQTHQGHPGAPLQPGITVFDAETDADLRQIVAGVRDCPHKALWIGTGGLAQALAADAPAPPLPPLPRPILGLFGSDQPTTAAQLAACAPHHVHPHDGTASSAETIARRLAATGIALATFAVPQATPRTDAAAHIARHIDHLARALPPPATLIASGGETLRRICQSLGATSLETQGRLLPGLPRAILLGGPWNGVTVVAKSGAFGHPTLLRDLLIDERNPP